MTRIPALRDIDRYYMSKPTRLDDLYPEPPNLDDLPDLRADRLLTNIGCIFAAVTGVLLLAAAAVIWTKLWERAV